MHTNTRTPRADAPRCPKRYALVTAYPDGYQAVRTVVSRHATYALADAAHRRAPQYPPLRIVDVLDFGLEQAPPPGTALRGRRTGDPQ